MKDRLAELAEKFGGYTKIPLKSTEIAPGVPRLVVEAQVIPSRNNINRGVSYIGKDGGSYYSWEVLKTANNLWRDTFNLPKSRRPLK